MKSVVVLGVLRLMCWCPPEWGEKNEKSSPPSPRRGWMATKLLGRILLRSGPLSRGGLAGCGVELVTSVERKVTHSQGIFWSPSPSQLSH
jgi:hypothetical protein